MPRQEGTLQRAISAQGAAASSQQLGTPPRGSVLREVIEREATVPTHTPEFSRIFQEHHGLVFRTAYRITGNAADAEDVMQTIFLRLLRSGSSLPATRAQPSTGVVRGSGIEPQPSAGVVRGSGIEKEESYFRRAAVNASLDLLRTRQSVPSVPLMDVAGKDETSPELRECLRRAFLALSPRSAEIFALRYLEDFSNQQIAEAMHMSQVLVAVTLHRARRQLQKEIRNYFGGRL